MLIFLDKIEEYLQSRAISGKLKQIEFELRVFAEGKSDSDTREQYYLDWENEVFDDVLRRLEEAEKA